jgi:hypothetical protein
MVLNAGSSPASLFHWIYNCRSMRVRCSSPFLALQSQQMLQEVEETRAHLRTIVPPSPIISSGFHSSAGVWHFLKEATGYCCERWQIECVGCSQMCRWLRSEFSRSWEFRSANRPKKTSPMLLPTKRRSSGNWLAGIRYSSILVTRWPLLEVAPCPTKSSPTMSNPINSTGARPVLFCSFNQSITRQVPLNVFP